MKKVTPVLVIACLVLSSCASNQPKAGSETSAEIKTGLVVRDFLVAISQIHTPLETTVQLNKPNSEFGIELERGFVELGFGVQRVTSDQGDMFLSYTKSTTENSSNIATTKYKVFVGDTVLSRDYAAATNGGIAPTGPMAISGTDTRVELNATLFPGVSSEVVYTDESSDDIAIEAGVITVIDANVMSAITKYRESDLPSYKSLNSQNQEIENLFNRGTSNFEAVDESYRTVRKDIIIFDNDSLVLKSKGREQIAKLMKFYDAKTDVFRLVGCSIGPTAVEGGNEELALGRSERVAKELISRDVQLASIFDEGCWAPTAGQTQEDYPARAVVIELQRRG